MDIDTLTKYRESLQKQHHQLITQALRVEGAIAAAGELIQKLTTKEVADLATEETPEP